MAVSSLSAPCREKNADPQRHDDRCDQRAQQQVAVQQVGNGHPRQDGVRQRIAHEGHAAQHHVTADHRAQDAHHQRGQQAALHEGISERVQSAIGS